MCDFCEGMSMGREGGWRDEWNWGGRFSIGINKDALLFVGHAILYEQRNNYLH